MKQWKAMAMAGVALAALVPQAAMAQTAREAELEARLKQLEDAVGALRAELEATRAEQSVAREQAGKTAEVATEAQTRVAKLEQAKPADGFRIGNTTVKLGGFVRVNAIASRYDDGEMAVGALGKEFYLPQQIPVGGSASSRDFLLSARQTRLSFGTSTPINGHELKSYVEFDFALAAAPVGAQRATNPYTPTFRRGFIQYGNLLVGQEWSTFQNVAVLPESTDFVGPLDGTVFVRQGIVQYKIPLDAGSNILVALENPQTETATLTAPATLVDGDDDQMPDLVVRLNSKQRFGEFALAGVARQLRTDTAGIGDTAFGWGVSGSGRIPFGPEGRHDLRFMATYGQGVGRYLSLGFVPDALYAPATGRLAVIDNFAAFGALKLGWTANLRSTFMASYQKASYPDDVVVSGLANAKAWSAAANLFWTPMKSLDVGVEYRHAVRELLSGDQGEMDRLEFAIKHGF